MKTIKLLLPLFATLTGAPAQALVVALLDSNLNSQSIFASSYVTTGVGAQVYGSFLAGAGATIGASSAVTGNFVAVSGATVGKDSTVGGTLLAGAGATLGSSSVVGGDFQAGAGADLGVNSTVGGNLYAGAAASLGAGSTVSGNLVAGAAATLGVGATVTGSTQSYTAPTFTGLPTDASVGAQATQVAKVQTGLFNLGAGTTLGATIAGAVSLNAGIYSATALTMAAGTALTLDGQGLANQLWVFNITDYLVTGAGATINLINGGLGSSIIWNTGGYTTMGADTAFLGTVFSGGYVSMGANTRVTGPNTSCGGIFSANSYVVLGADAQVGSVGCSGASSAYWYAVDAAALEAAPTLLANADAAPAESDPPPTANEVPEPATLGLVLASLAALAVSSRRPRSPLATRRSGSEVASRSSAVCRFIEATAASLPLAPACAAVPAAPSGPPLHGRSGPLTDATHHAITRHCGLGLLITTARMARSLMFSADTLTVFRGAGPTGTRHAQI